VTRLRTLTRTSAGREVFLLEIGYELDRVRPAVCITAGLHAFENVGTEVALTMAESLVALQKGEDVSFSKLRTQATRMAAGALYYLIPMISPDANRGRVKR